MASTIILSDNGASSGSAGLKQTAGNDGVLILQTTTSGGTATNAVYVDNNQNIGLGTTPSGWYSTSSQALQFGVGATYSHTYSGTTGYGIAYNTYSSSVGGGWKYVANGYAHIFEQSDAYQTLYSSDSGTAGASVSSLTQTLALGKGVSLSLQGATPKTGTGITFPATQSASSDANTLDDYEEGSFTPTVIGTSTAGTANYLLQAGRYTKIGNRVFFDLAVYWNSGTGAGALRVGGLPFTCNGTLGSAVSGGSDNLSLTASNFLSLIQVQGGATYIEIYQNPTGGGSLTNVSYDAAANVWLSGFYFV